MVSFLRHEQGEVLEMRVAAGEDIAEKDPLEQFFHFHLICRAESLQDPPEFLVADVVLVVFSVSFFGPAAEPAEILLGYFPSVLPVKTSCEVLVCRLN